MKILVTGGAGSIGSNLVRSLEKLGVANIIVMDNNEYALSIMEDEFSGKSNIKLALGDVRDRERLRYLMKNVDIVVHMAAYKRVEVSERNMPEVIKVNVEGALNVVEICQKVGVKKVLLISTDKAVPYDDMSIYGATKLLQEKIFLLANEDYLNEGYCFKASVARFGNVIGTRGDVTEIWAKQHDSNKPLAITDLSMKRFFWTMREATDFITRCIDCMQGGEIFIPKIKEYGIIEYAEKLYGKGVKYKVVGTRSGEVLSHVLMTTGEKLCAKDIGWGFVIKRLPIK